MSNVTFKSASGVSLTVALGSVSPIITDGVSTWDTVARPKRESITRYTGRTPYKQDIAVLFDGYADDDSQESEISKLVNMAAQPHTITVSGQALKKSLDWVIEGVDWDSQDTIWMMLNGRPQRVRQAATVHLLEYVKETIIKTPAAPSISSKKSDKHPTKKISTPAGMTAKQIAQIEFGDPDKWRLIYSDNPWLGPPDPRRIIPKGTSLVILDGNIPGFVVP